jgi:GNAT superfamily N-acetyltransferase
MGVLDEADRNMVSAWERLITLAPTPGRVVLAGSVTALSSGIPIAMFNSAHVTSPVRDPDEVVDAVRDHYAAIGAPFSLVFRDAVAPGLADACQAAGLVEHWQMPLMVLDPIPPIPDPPAGLNVVRADGSSSEAYADVLAEAFGMPQDLARSLLGRSLLEMPEFGALLGTLDGTPVATSAVFVTDRTAGVYNVATLPSARGRGFGAALTWAAVAAGRDAGATRSVLQASEMGEPVYTRMGYGTPDRYRQFEPPPTPS